MAKHKHIDADAPFKSWMDAAGLVLEITNDWLEIGQDRHEADSEMIRRLTRLHFKLQTTAAKKK